MLVLLALASGLVFPTVTAMVSHRAPEAAQGGTLGVLASAGGLARLLAPIGATVLFQEVWIGAPFLVGGILLAVCGVMAATHMVRAATAS